MAFGRLESFGRVRRQSSSPGAVIACADDLLWAKPERVALSGKPPCGGAVSGQQSPWPNSTSVSEMPSK